MRVVILNSTVLPSPQLMRGGKPYVVIVAPSNLAAVHKAASEGAVSYIGHEGTAKSLGLPFNRGQVTDYDCAYVVRLKTRLAEGQVLSSVNENQVEVLELTVAKQ